MLTLRARFDGNVVHLPEDTKPAAPCDVIVLVEEPQNAEDADWLRLQEQTLAKAWDDKEDSIYDEA